MSRVIRRLMVSHKLKVAIETMSEEYPIVLVQDSYSPHIRIPRFVDHRLSNNPLVWSSYDASHPRWSQLRSKSLRAPTLTLSIASQLHVCCPLAFPTKTIQKVTNSKHHNYTYQTTSTLVSSCHNMKRTPQLEDNKRFLDPIIPYSIYIAY